jgi:hypothetical protein
LLFSFLQRRLAAVSPRRPSFSRLVVNGSGIPRIVIQAASRIRDKPFPVMTHNPRYHESEPEE